MHDRKIPRDKGFNAVRHLISEILLLVNENKSITKHKKHLLIRLAHQAAAAVNRSLKENPHA